MKTMKKVLSVLLLVGMLASMCVTGAYADDPTAPALELAVSATTSTADVTGNVSLTVGSIEDYTLTWHYVIENAAGGSDTVENVFGSTVTWHTDRIVNGSEIYVTAIKGADESTKLESNHVTVYYTDIVTNVKVTPDSATLAKGGYVELTATVLPEVLLDRSVTWSASPADVVAVDAAGKVTVLDTATSSQTVTVTATSNADTSKFAIATINVTIPVTITNVAVTWNDSTKQYEATPTFSNGSSVADHTVTWSWSADKAGVTVTGSGNACTIANATEAEIKDITLTATATALDGLSLSPGVPGTLLVSSLPGKDKAMDISIGGTTLYAGRSYALSAVSGSDPVTVGDLSFAIEGDAQGSAFTTDGKIAFGIKATSVTVQATATGYSKATKTFTIQPNVALAAAKSTLTAGKSDSTALTAKYVDDSADIPGITWSITAHDGADDATIDGSTLKAGAKSGSVTCTAKSGEAVLGNVTVTINANSNIQFTVAVIGNSTTNTLSDTIYAKKGIISLQAGNAIDTSDGDKAVSGTYRFFSAANTGSPVGGIGLTDNGNNTATVSGIYNGTYIIKVEFTPTGTSDVITKYHTVYVNYTPTFVGGNYAVWDGVNGLDFLVDDSFSNWDGQIWVDGHLLSNTNYLCRGSSDGRIWVTLKPEFISWLRQYYNGNGTHTITVGISGRNAATGYFKTWGTASSFNGVKTGDDANLGLWTTLLTLSAAGTAAAVVIYKRKKTNG